MSKNSVKRTSSDNSLLLDGFHLTIEQIESVARQSYLVELAPDSRRRIQRNADTIRQLAISDKPIYGVNTGFGVFVSQPISSRLSSRLSRNLVLSHSTGLGKPFSEDISRAAMLVRINTLAHGLSGVRPLLLDTLINMLNQHVTPWIPSQGSLGSSGDLAPLAHLGLIISKDSEIDSDKTSGKAWYSGKLMSGKQAMAAADLPRVILGPKEGLALTNGATFTAAILALTCYDISRVLFIAEIAAAMSMESLLAISQALDPRIHDARPHPGQQTVARNIRNLIRNSSLIDSSLRVQDAYSIRCTPQVLGPAREILKFVKSVVEREINSATDNPLFFGEEAICGGNFHGEPLGLAADYLKIALAEVGAISERRVFRLTTPDMNNGLPPMLIADSKSIGLQSGIMMLQYTAASLVLENQSLSSPDSVHSLPTSAGQEDHNANATTAARRLLQIIDNLKYILSIELIAAAQALDLRLENNPSAQLGDGTSLAMDCVRRVVPFHKKDAPFSDEIEAIVKLIDHGDFLKSFPDTTFSADM
jgi:histidine ammonia-lyase